MADHHAVKPAGPFLPTHNAAAPPTAPKWVPWRDRVKYFSWQWHGIVTATAVVSSLLHLWPYHNYADGLKIIACIVFLIGLVVFTFNLFAKIARVIMFPKDSLTHITDPAKSSFAGFLAVGGAGLIDAAVNIVRDWHPGAKNGLLFSLYGLWWLDAFFAWFTCFGVIFFILGQKSKDLGKVMAIWIIPCVSMIASASCGGLLAGTLYPEFPRLALITTTFAITMGIVGLSFTMMITFGFLLRLFVHGAPEGMVALASFNTLTPLGQGGFCLLINGANFSKLVPYVMGDDFPEIAIAGKLIFSVCFCGAYILWCMGIAWVMLSVFAIFRRVKKLPRFGIAWWGLVFPNGTFALLSVQLGNVLESRFYHGFGAAWSLIVFMMWTILMLRSIPAFIDGTMFLPPQPYLEGRKKRKEHKRRLAEEKNVGAQPRGGTHSPERDDRSTLVNADGARHHEQPDVRPPMPTLGSETTAVRSPWSSSDVEAARPIVQ